MVITRGPSTESRQFDSRRCAISVGTVHRTPSRLSLTRESPTDGASLPRLAIFVCATLPGTASTFTELSQSTTLRFITLPTLGHGTRVLYCRVYSATALKHSLVGFLPRAPCGPADSIELVGQADVLCAGSLHHSIYWIVSHAPATIPPPFAGLPDASSPLPRLCWPGLVPMYSPQCAAYIEDVGRRALPLA